MRSCPKCRVAMNARDYEGVPIEVCPGCEGTWLDDGELNAVCEAREVAFDRAACDQFFAELHASQARKKDYAALVPQLGCPDCLDQMSRLEYAYNSTVVIDRCPGCGGMFLDRSELEKLQMWTEERDAYQANMPTRSYKGFLPGLLDGLVNPRRRSRWRLL